MAKRVERLTFTQFRGGCQPVTFDFEPHKQIVLIFGENGTGKSSIADAIDFVCNNEFGSLRDRSGTLPKTHVVSLNGQAKELAVSIRYGGKEWHARLQSGKPVTQPANPPRAFILRRTDITRVMEAAPADRYKTLQSYITVPKVEQAESELRKAHKTMQDSVERAVRDRTQASETLEAYWRAEGKPDSDSFTWASRETSGNVDVQKVVLNGNRRLGDGIRQALDGRASLAAAQQHVSAGEARLAQAEAALQAAVAGQVGQSGTLVALLEDAQRYLGSLATGEQPCPICGKPDDRGVLLQRVGAQLQQLSHLQQLRGDQQRAQSQLTAAQGALRTAQAAFVKSCSNLCGLALDAGVEFAEAIDSDALQITGSDAQAIAAAEAALLNLGPVQQALAATIEKDQKTINQWTALRTLLQTTEDADRTMREQAAVAQRLKTLLEVVERQRKTYVDQVVHAISRDVNALYARIHPDEPLGGSSFHLKPSTTGSLELRAQFGGMADVVPGAYYSEAHLDTLGLCVYLALAKRVGGSVVVLDDVLTSVDAAHLERIIDLINDEVDSLGHLIITTHSRLWLERMRGAKGLHNADVIELYSWNLTHGIRHERCPFPVEELRQVVSGGRLDRQSAASKAGVLLEQLLDELALLYRCRVPRKKPAEYTLGELGDAIDSKLGKVLVAEQQQPDGTWASVLIKPLVTACTEYSWVRNHVGAHSNSNAANIPDSMVREFCNRALRLADAMICPHCHQLPVKKKFGEYWQCGGGCGKTRLRPLETPS